jgi:hypothetical protein
MALTKVTIGCDVDLPPMRRCVAEQPERVGDGEEQFPDRLGLSDGPKLDQSVTAVIEKYGKSDTQQGTGPSSLHAAKHFGKKASTPRR